MLRDFLAFLGTSITCASYIMAIGWLARHNVLEKHLSRKVMHIGNGLLYLLFWPSFSCQPAARFICASVPALAALHFALVGLGVTKDDALVSSATRSGHRQELLRGPFLYGAIISAITALYWRDSPVGATAIAVLCAGDGFADIVGRRYGSGNRLPHSLNKSWAGSGACWAAGWVASMGCVLFLQSNGNRDGPSQILDTSTTALGCGLTSFIGALVESLPVAEIDNVTVPLAVAIAGHFAF